MGLISARHARTGRRTVGAELVVLRPDSGLRGRAFVVVREKHKGSREPDSFATDFLVGLVPSLFRFHRGRIVPNVQVRSVSNLPNSANSRLSITVAV
jgi:hypothetical protein